MAARGTTRRGARCMTRGRGPAPHENGASTGPKRVTIDIADAGDTPILREYRRVKAEHPDAIVLVRLGDFFEMLGTDAELAAPLLGLTLTGRGFGTAGRVPMCGVPHHAAPGHIQKLMQAGHQVVVWDQVGEAESGRLVERAVTRIVSAGTVIEADYLEEGRTARLVALLPTANGIQLAALDAAAGELELSCVAGGLATTALVDACERLDVAELLIPDDAEIPETVAPGVTRRRLAASLFESARGRDRLMQAMGVATLDALALDESVHMGAAGALLAYCERARLRVEGGALRVRRHSGSGMALDPQTRRNLELFRPLGGGSTALIHLLDRTRTPMGARLLRARLHEPLVEPLLINARLDAVDWMVMETRRRERLRDALAGVRDVERLVGRCVQGIATPRDLAALRSSLQQLPEVHACLTGCDAVELREAAVPLASAPPVLARLESLLNADPPPSARDGGSIAPGADPALDALHASSRDARTFIAEMEERERAATGIRSLKVGYNRVFGYYIEVPNTHGERVPDSYIRKQTLVGAERYITADLKEHETIVLSAKERAVARELELLAALVAEVVAAAHELLAIASSIAVIDVTQALADAAVRRRWIRPEIDASSVIDIEAGRHPLVEEAIPAGRFVPNDTSLDASDRIVVLTGPNMAGKSTFLRQVAVLTLLAHVGSFVPAKRARIGVCDRIFTRVGAHDDLAAGLSTFMVEMSETAAILRQATTRSLVILDEIGRGTSTYDGLSIAQAIVEHIHDAPHLNCRTLFATHYHELTALADSLPRVRNARVEVLEDGGHVTFLHRIVEGGADRSYGIHVAKLAGLPASVVARSRQLLASLEVERPLAASGPVPDQLSLEIASPPVHPVVDELSSLDLDELTPLAALNKLAEWHARIT